LSLDLRTGGPFSLSDEEKRASAMMSVIVPVHDAPEVTRRCLASLERFGGDAEVVLVDDGSTLEQTRRLLDEFCARNNWKMVRHQTALGHSRASEAGICVSSRPCLCLLNSDTVVTPRSWFGISKVFDNNPAVAVVGPSTSHTPTPQCVDRACHCRYYWSDEQIWLFAKKYTARWGKQPPTHLPKVGGFAFFVRRSVWDRFGGFDKSLADYGNEMELCQRIGTAGLKIAWTKASYIHHLGHASYQEIFGMELIRKKCQAARRYIDQKWLKA
jgi:GT2 family glycosyltransferase